MLEPDLSWQDDAACIGYPLELFFADGAGSTAPGGYLCKSCPVKRDCLEYALSWPPDDLHGIWADTTKNQRKRILRRGG